MTREARHLYEKSIRNLPEKDIEYRRAARRESLQEGKHQRRLEEFSFYKTSKSNSQEVVIWPMIVIVRSYFKESTLKSRRVLISTMIAFTTKTKQERLRLQ